MFIRRRRILNLCRIINDSFSRTRFKTSTIGPMYFKSNEIEQYYTSFVIWVKCRNRPRYWPLLTDTSNLGYAVSYDKVMRYKQSGLMKTKLDHLKNEFMPFVAENVDHNNDTLDVKVPSMGWALLLVQSWIRLYMKKKWSKYQQF